MTKFKQRFYLFLNDFSVLRRYVYSVSRLVNKILTSPILTASSVLIVIAVLVVGSSMYWDVYDDRNFQMNLISEMHGMLFDILVLGILMLWLNRMGEKRMEVRKYIEEIDDFRKLDNMEARQRVVGNIKRLNKRGIHDLDLRSCQLVGANLQDVDLTNSNLFEANLTEAILQGANCSAAIFVSANLSSANLMGASLQQANFSNARLHHANLWEANLLRTNFEGADLSHGHLEGVNASEADFSSSILAGIHLLGANLSRANFLGALAEGGDFSGATLEEARCTEADFSGASLIETECMSGDFSQCNFSFANLTKANFSNANLCGVSFNGANCSGALFFNANLNSAYLVGANNLKAEQLKDVISLENATIGSELLEEIQQLYPYLMGHLAPQ